MLDENHGICTAATGPSPSTKMNCLYLEISHTAHYILSYFSILSKLMKRILLYFYRIYTILLKSLYQKIYI